MKPAVVYRMGGKDAQMLNVNKSAFELLAGVTYHFSCSNGKHYMTIQRPYDPYEVKALNDKVNALRATVEAQEAALNDSEAKTDELQNALDVCRNALNDCQNTPIATIIEKSHTMSLESVVTFRQGSTSVGSDQIPNVERIATYMKNHPESTVSIKGYASPEGSAEVNARIAKQRADAVKKILMNRYKIDESRITSEGQGVGNMFSEPDWNRVSIATLNDENAE